MEKSDRINVALKETNMKKCVVFMAAVVLTSLLSFRVSAQVAIDETHFPDSVFRAYVQENFDTDHNGSLSEAECEAVRTIDVSGTYDSYSLVSDLTGIGHFPVLDTLNCSYAEITNLDLDQNPVLEYLNCSFTGITSLDLSQNPALKYLDCGFTGITNLDLSQNPALKYLNCISIGITSLNLNQNPALYILICAGTGITSLDLSQNLALYYLQCNHTGLTSLDVSQNPALTQLVCSDNPSLTVIHVNGASALESLDCGNTGITSLDLSQNPVLDYLNCQNTKITSLDVSRNPALTSLLCLDTEITSLDLSQNPALDYLYCSNTKLTSLDVSRNPELEVLFCQNAELSHIDLSQNSALQTVDFQGNVRSVKVGIGDTYDLGQIEGFDLSRVTWNSNTEIEGSLLRFTTESIAYEYDIRLGGNEYKVAFTLKAVPDLAAEGQSEPVSFRAWTESGQLHLEGAGGMVEVFDLGGRCLYRGQSSVIPLPGSGIYLVRNQGRSQKVVNL